MRTAWHIFVRDLRRIFTNPVAAIVTLGVAIVPCLYAWINIAANWDPYENTSDIAVAIVNEDEGAEAGSMGWTNAGDMIVEELGENDQLGWTFVDYDDAMEGVSSGEYYAAIVIPEDFTASLADVIDGDTTMANIDYYVNEKINPVAPKVTDTGATTIEDQISSRFAGVVAEVVTERLQGFAGSAIDGTDEAEGSLRSDIATVRGTVDDLVDEISSVNATIESARGSIAQGQATLTQLADTSEGASLRLQLAADGLGTTRSDAQGLAAALYNAVATGSTAISGISSQASAGIGNVTGSVSFATARLDTAISTLDAAIAETEQLSVRLTSVRSVMAKVTLGDATLQREIVNELDREITLVNGQAEQQRASLATLQALSDDIKSGNATVQNLNDSVNAAIQTSATSLNGVMSTIATDTLPQVSGALDTFSDAASQITVATGGIAPLLRQASATLSQVDQTLVEAEGAIDQTADTLASASELLASIETDLGTVQTTEAWLALQTVASMNMQSVTDLMESPAVIDEIAIFPVENYGSGIAPFFTSVALWVGGIAIIVIYKLEVDREGVEPFKPWQGYVGRLLLCVFVGLLQAIVCCTGDLLLGIQCISPVAFYFAAMVASFVFVNIIFALSVAFKHIGRALAFLLIILQVPGSSGMYPIEMMTPFFQALNPWLPFTYSNNAMRETIGGFYGSYYAHDLLVLCLFLVPALLIGLGARRHLLNINALFDKSLRETDLVVAEHDDMNEAHFKLSTIIKVVMNSDEYKDVFLERAAGFELVYPALVKWGIVAVIAIPVALLVLLYILPYKMVILTLWIISLIACCTYLIVVEYLHARVEEKTELASKSPEELYAMLDDSLKHEVFAFAPIEKIRHRHESHGEAGKGGDSE